MSSLDWGSLVSSYLPWGDAHERNPRIETPSMQYFHMHLFLSFPPSPNNFVSLGKSSPYWKTYRGPSFHPTSLEEKRMNEALGPKISPNFSTSLPSFSLTSNSKFAALLILANPKAITIYLDENHLQHLPHHLIPLQGSCTPGKRALERDSSFLSFLLCSIELTLLTIS